MEFFNLELDLDLSAGVFTKKGQRKWERAMKNFEKGNIKRGEKLIQQAMKHQTK